MVALYIQVIEPFFKGVPGCPALSSILACWEWKTGDVGVNLLSYPISSRVSGALVLSIFYFRVRYCTQSVCESTVTVPVQTQSRRRLHFTSKSHRFRTFIIVNSRIPWHHEKKIILAVVESHFSTSSSESAERVVVETTSSSESEKES